MGRSRWAPVPRRIQVAQPAAGASWTQLNDSGGLWLVRALTFTFVTSAVVATRFAAITATAGEDVWFRTTAQLGQLTTLTRNYAAWAGSPASTVDATTLLMPWPTEGLWLPPGHVLASTVALIDVGDQLSAVTLTVIEYPEVLPSHLAPMPYTFTEDDQE